MHTFPHKTRSPPWDSRTTWCLINGWPRHSLSEALAPYERVDRTNLHPLHLLVYLFKSSHNLINYARAHNSLWLHTEVSSKNNLMIPLSLGGGPYTYRQHWVLQVPQSTQMWVLVATLSEPLVNNLTSIMNISQTQSMSTSIAWQYNSNVEVTPKGLIRKQVIGTTSTTSQNPTIWLDPNHAIVWGIDLMQ